MKRRASTKRTSELHLRFHKGISTPSTCRHDNKSFTNRYEIPTWVAALNFYVTTEDEKTAMQHFVWCFLFVSQSVSQYLKAQPEFSARTNQSSAPQPPSRTVRLDARHASPCEYHTEVGWVDGISVTKGKVRTLDDIQPQTRSFESIAGPVFTSTL